MMMQLRTSELTPLNQKLIPEPLALAFGIAIDDNFGSNKEHVRAQPSPYKALVPQRKASSLRQQQQDAENAGGTQSAADGRLLPTAADLPSIEQPTASQPQITVKRAALQQPQLQPEQDVLQVAPDSQAAAAALLANPSAAAAQAAASMQTTSSLSAGYPHHHQHHAVHMAHAAHAATANAAVMHASLHGFPATAYGFNPHAASLLPYIAPAPQVAVSNLTGSLGCPPMSVYSGPADYGRMVRSQQQEEAQDDNQARALKRPRLVWTPQLHSLFEEAVQKLGLEKAVPKTIMQMMNVDGLTRENVASHLQKYRLSLKKTEPEGKSVSAADGPDATSAEKVLQQDAAAASGAATGGAEAGTSSSAGNVGNGGSCSSSEPDGAGSSNSQGARSEKVTLHTGEPPPTAEAAAPAEVAAVDAAADAPSPMQVEQQVQQ